MKIQTSVRIERNAQVSNVDIVMVGRHLDQFLTVDTGYRKEIFSRVKVGLSRIRIHSMSN